MVKHKRGQSIVEFAIVLPFFVVMLMAAFYLTLLCYDVMTLSTYARDSARQLAVQTKSYMPTTRYNLIIKRPLRFNGMYAWEPAKTTAEPTLDDDFYYKANEDVNNPSVRVILKAKVNQSYTGAFFISKFLPDYIYAESTMYWEKYSTT